MNSNVTDGDQFQVAIYDFKLRLCAAVGSQQRPTLDEVLKFAKVHFIELCDEQKLMKLIRVIRKTLESSTATNATAEMLCNLLKSQQEQQEQAIALQIVREVWHALPVAERSNDESWTKLYKLIFAMLSYDNNNNNKIMIAKILTCLRLFAEKFERFDLLKELWTNDEVAQHRVQIAVQLFDDLQQQFVDFTQDAKLIASVQNLLQQQTFDARKTGLYLLKKIAQIESAQAEQVQHFWSTYITVLENLTANQSHLILPTLQALAEIHNETQQLKWTSWMHLLYAELLQHKNILVTRWTIEYFLLHFKCHTLHEELLELLLQALNQTHLYNLNGYFLPAEKLQNFLMSLHDKFLDLFAKVNWSSVPLHNLLCKLNALKPTCQVCEQNNLLQIASKVRLMQNLSLRTDAIAQFQSLFAKSIEFLLQNQPNDYVQLHETLLNAKDYYATYQLDKIFANFKGDTASPIAFNQRSYEICSRQFYTLCQPAQFVAAVLSYLSKVPKQQHHWLRFLVVFDFNEQPFKASGEDPQFAEQVQAFRLQTYGIDTAELANCNLQQVSAALSNALIWPHSKEQEKQFIKTKAIDFFVNNCLKSYADLAKHSITVQELLELGTYHTFAAIIRLLADKQQIAEETLNATTLDALVDAYKKYDFFLLSDDLERLGKIIELMPADLAPKYAAAFLSQNIDNVWIIDSIARARIKLSSDYFCSLILEQPIKTGDALIEDVYMRANLNYSSAFAIRKIRFASMTESALQMHLQLSQKRPRYFENSAEHRYKMRIAGVICNCLKDVQSSLNATTLWHIVLKENNQFNITCIYELLTAMLESNFENILTKLKEAHTYTASQQTSVICVAHAYIILKLLNKQLPQTSVDEILQHFAPLNLGANFQTRLYAQLAFYSILQTCAQNNIMLNNDYSVLKMAIESLFAIDLQERLHDIRLKLPFLVSTFHSQRIFDCVMFVTNAPLDEYDVEFIDNEKQLKVKLLKSKQIFDKKTNKMVTTFNEQIVNNHCNPVETEICNEHVALQMQTNNVQRKIHPNTDVLIKDDFLTVSEQSKNNQLMVVATLIDKLPNLGGIARTCEVLGIKNYVIASKTYAEKADFKNISMTAEKNLNIIEVTPTNLMNFLIKKQCEGFKIVGAEQTANSTNFENFMFPKKCLLLLGHEKEGIPANLINLLDYVVEIPQFGQVRSLNVHVTGALFIWEYCKQHIIEK